MRLLKNHVCGLLAIISSLVVGGDAFAYCASKGTSVSYEWINGVSFGSFSNTSGANAGYADFTSQTIELVAGANSLSLTPGFRSGSYSERWKVWIDFNRDEVFSDSEAVFSGSSNSTVSGSLTVPTTASSGTTRMRVSMRYGNTPLACGNFTYGEVEDYTVNLSVDDMTPPAVASRTPAAGASDVPPNTSITVTFSENIDPLTVSDSSISLSGNGQFVGGAVSLNGNVVTFVPNSTLANSTEYTATVYAGLQDLAGNALQQDAVWSFTTLAADLTAPTITWVSPQNGDNDVDYNFVVQAQFSEPMDPATINSSTFSISDGVNAVTGNVVLSSGGRVLQFYHSQPFAYLTHYTATVTSGAKDLAGNPLQADYSWTFTSREFQPQYCSSYAGNYSYMWIAAVKVGSHTHWSTSQPATGYSDNTSTVFELSRSFPNSVSLTPGYSGSAYTTYWRVFIDWNKDGVFAADEIALSQSGNTVQHGSIQVPVGASGGNTRMRVSMQYSSYPNACSILSYGEVEDFRVSIPAPPPDTTPPQVVSVSPADGEQNVAVTAALTVNFSEPIDAGTLNADSLAVTGGSSMIALTLTYNESTHQAVFTPTAELEYGTTYTATVYSGIEDLAANAMPSDYSWSFTTATAPVPTYTVSGLIQYQAAGLAGVTITADGDSTFVATTDNNGGYSFAALPAGSYLITASKAGYTFSPPTVGLDVVDSDITGVNFNADKPYNPLTNGDFETGNLSGFNTYTTPSGSMASGVVLFDTDQDGTTSLAAKFIVGNNGSGMGTQQGGGLYQTVVLKGGDLTVSADIAATTSSNNGSGGQVGIYLDGQLMASHDFGGISAGVNEYDSLSFYLPEVAAGNHEIRIQVTRTYAVSSVANYVDNIVMTGSSTE